MKKLIILWSIILAFTFSTVNVFADDNLSIRRNIVNSILLENGDLEISQDITYEFNDSFNGVYWNIGLKDTDGISDVKVYELVDGSEVEYIQNVEPKKGESGLFKSTQNSDNLELMIFSPSKDESKTFRIKYVLNNVAIRHGDTGELYYQFIGRSNEERIDYFSATIKLPAIDKDKVKIFAHGPLNGEIHFAENNTVKLEIEGVRSNTFVEARILFPLEYISASTKTGTDNLDSIVEEELSFIKDIEKKEAKSEQTKGLLDTTSAILSAIGAAIIYFFFNKFRRDPAVFENMDSVVPEDISPAELKLFMSSMMDGRSLIATLFDLARREYIRIDNIETQEETKKGLFQVSKEKEEEYSFTKTNKATLDLLPHEFFFIDWMFNEIGNGFNVTTIEIDQHRTKQPSLFTKSYANWNKLIKEDLKSRNYHDENSKKYVSYLLLPALLFMVLGAVSIVAGGFIGIVLVLFSLAMFIMSISIGTRKSDNGFVQHGLWKQFMKEMDAFKDLKVDIPTDKYLIYAIALGITMKKMNEYRDTVSYGYYPMYWGAFYYGGINKSGGSKFEDSLNGSFYGSVGTSTSSSVGGGGGFSGGGGGGAGGGGGGGGF